MARWRRVIPLVDRLVYDAVEFGNEYTRAEMQRHRRFLVSTMRWLAGEFPTPYPVYLFQHPNLRDDGGEILHGMTTLRASRRLKIEVHAKAPLVNKVDTLLHEWAHCHVWRHMQLELRRLHGGHDDEFWLALGKIMARWEACLPPGAR